MTKTRDSSAIIKKKVQDLEKFLENELARLDASRVYALEAELLFVKQQLRNAERAFRTLYRLVDDDKKDLLPNSWKRITEYRESIKTPIRARGPSQYVEVSE